MKSFIFALFSLTLGFLSPFAQAQNAFLQDEGIFDRRDLKISGRLRQLTLEEVLPQKGKEIVILERRGKYPNWKLWLTVWHASQRLGEIELPADTLFYSFIPRKGSVLSWLFLVRPETVELWPGQVEKNRALWKMDARFVAPSEFSVPVSQVGNAHPFDPMVSKDQLLVPTIKGHRLFQFAPDGLVAGETFVVLPKAFHRTSTEQPPFSIPFSTRSSLWHTQFFLGSLTGSTPPDQLFFPWMDELKIASFSDPKKVVRHDFAQLTEEERDDAQSYVVALPEDLNGDGRSDFVVSKFKGQAASLVAQTHLYVTQDDGSIPKKGLFVPPRGNRAAGVLPIDLNRNGKKDLVVASSQFNTWSIIKAVVQREIDVNFSFYYLHPDGYRLVKPDFEREISFTFNLSDLFIDGMLPTLDGDFNGDGFVDALYARDRKQVTVLLQQPKSKALFAPVPSGTYDVPVLRLWRVGDLNGDKKSDVVLYDRRSKKNRRVTVLTNRGNLN